MKHLYNVLFWKIYKSIVLQPIFRFHCVKIKMECLYFLYFFFIFLCHLICYLFFVMERINVFNGKTLIKVFYVLDLISYEISIYITACIAFLFAVFFRFNENEFSRNIHYSIKCRSVKSYCTCNGKKSISVTSFWLIINRKCRSRIDTVCYFTLLFVKPCWNQIYFLTLLFI